MKGEPQQSFKNALEVLDFLEAEGWKVSKTSLYNHIKAAKLRPETDGTFTRRAVLAYARAHLQLLSTRQKTDDEDLQRKKLLVDIAVQSERLKREKLKREQEEGLLIPREDVDLELAARAVVQDHEWTRAIQARSSEIIALVGGDTAHAAELVRFLMEIKDEILNEFASTRFYHVLFASEGGE